MNNEWKTMQSHINEFRRVYARKFRECYDAVKTEIPRPETPEEAESRMRSLWHTLMREIPRSKERLMETYGFDVLQGKFTNTESQIRYAESPGFHKNLKWYAKLVVADKTICDEVAEWASKEVRPGLIELYMCCMKGVIVAWYMLETSLQIKELQGLIVITKADGIDWLPIAMLSGLASSRIPLWSQRAITVRLQDEYHCNPRMALHQELPGEVLYQLVESGRLTYQELLSLPGKADGHIGKALGLEIDARNNIGKKKRLKRARPTQDEADCKRAKQVDMEELFKLASKDNFGEFDAKEAANAFIAVAEQALRGSQERRVFQLLLERKSEMEIASQLSAEANKRIGIGTVRKAIYRVRNKLKPIYWMIFQP
jgi:hypothetical protein